MHLGNTDMAPYGMGSRGARGGTAGGGVLLIAAAALRDKVLAIAAALLGLNTGGELRLWEGASSGWSAATGPTPGSRSPMSRASPIWIRCAAAGHGAGLEAHRTYDPPPMTFSNATHVCEVGVDVETGRLAIERYLVAEDCGTRAQPGDRARAAAGRRGDGHQRRAVGADRLRRNWAERDRELCRLCVAMAVRNPANRDDLACTRPAGARRPAARACPRAA